MDDPLLVRRLERLGDLARDRQRLLDRDRSARDPIGERRPFDQLEHQRLDAVGLLEAVDRRDVRMVERREHLRLALEARQPLGVGDERLGQHLERHLALEPGVAGAPDLAHAACAEGGEDLVRSQARAWL